MVGYGVPGGVRWQVVVEADGLTTDEGVDASVRERLSDPYDWTPYVFLVYPVQPGGQVDGEGSYGAHRWSFAGEELRGVETD